jgi:hypothetical protein
MPVFYMSLGVMSFMATSNGVKYLQVLASVNLSYKGFEVSFSTTSFPWNNCGRVFLGCGVFWHIIMP